MDYDEDRISVIPLREYRPGMSQDDDTRTLDTAYEDGDYFFDPISMSKSRTAAEIDFYHSFDKQAVVDAEKEPKRHNLIFILFMIGCFIGALIIDIPRKTMPRHSLPCDGFTSSQKRDGGDGTPRQDLLSNCQYPDKFPESMRPSTTSTYPVVKMNKRLEWAATYSNASVASTVGAIGTGSAPMLTSRTSNYPPPPSASTFPGTGSSSISAPGAASIVATTAVSAFPSASPASNSTCSTDGQIICNGPQFFGICSHRSISWQHVSDGTECKDGQIFGTGIYGPSATDNGGIQLRQATSTGYTQAAPTLTTLSSYRTGRGGATAWGPEYTMTTVTTLGSKNISNTSLRPTAGNTVLYDSSPLVVNRKGYPGKCHAEPDRHIGDPDMSVQ